MMARAACLATVLLAGLGGCAVGLDYQVTPEQDDSVVGVWRSDNPNGREAIYAHVRVRNSSGYSVVIIQDDLDVMRFDVLLSRVDRSTYVNIDLSSWSHVSRRSNEVGTLERRFPVYFLYRYEKNQERVVLVAMDQEKLIRDFRERPGLGLVGGDCKIPLSGSEAGGKKGQCTLAVRDRKGFEEYLRSEQESLFPIKDGRALEFRKVQ